MNLPEWRNWKTQSFQTRPSNLVGSNPTSGTTEHTAIKVGVLALLLLNVLDIATTYYAIHTVGAEELNPLAAFLIHTNLLIPLKLGIVGGIVYTSLRKSYKSVLSFVNLCVLYWIVGLYTMTVFMNIIITLKGSS